MEVELRKLTNLYQSMSSDETRIGDEGGASRRSEPWNEILQEIRDSEKRTEDRLKRLEADVQRGQEEALEKAAKRAKREKPYTFRKKSHQIQFDFNEQVAACIDNAKDELTKRPTTATGLTKAVKALEDGMELLTSRQELIKIADRSELGWKVVDEYEADELASGSEDEKKLERAERTAERKAVKKRKTTGRQGPRNYAGRLRQSAIGVSTQPVSWPRSQSLQSTPVQMRNPPQLTRPAPVVGPCFGCGEMGHLRRFCPKTAPGQARWYPCNSDVRCMDGVTKESVNCIDRRGKREWAGCVNDVDEGVDGLLVENSGEVSVYGVTSPLCDGGVDCYRTKSNRDESGLLQDDMSEDVVNSSELDHEGMTVVDQCWEYERATNTGSVKGKLVRSVKFWEEVLQAPDGIVDVIKSGYVMPFRSPPTKFCKSNQNSALINGQFVDQAIDELLADGRVKEVDEQPWVCSPLSVVESSTGKKRLVLNLRHVNKFLQKQRFKYEDLRIAMLLFERGEYMFTFDLKSGYHHVDICPVQQTYLGFAWVKGGIRRFYVFTVLPFGLATACYIFTKMLRPLVKYWRGKGIKVVVYLDDGIGAAKNREIACEASECVKDTLVKAGFVINFEKSHWDPLSQARWLGFLIDLNKGCLSVPPDKIVALENKLAALPMQKEVRVKDLASVTGKLIAMSPGIGHVSRLMTRAMYAMIESRVSWCDVLTVNEQAKCEIEFWISGLRNFNSQPIWHRPSAVRIVYSDASDTGYGGYMVEHGPHVAHGQWTQEEAKLSSTLRELKAVRLVLESVADKLQGARVRWFTDNQNVVRILEVGSRKYDLQEEVVRVFNLTLQYQIHLEPSWVPRVENQYADYLSRIVDYDDWKLNPGVFMELDRMFGPHSIDRFASFHNKQVDRFNSRYWNPGSEAVDVFTVDWSGENNWFCPPVALIPRVLRHAQHCKAEGTLVVPGWESAPFWPLVCPDGKNFASFVVAWCELPCIERLFIPGRRGTALFDGQRPNTLVLALRLCFH